jgi:hypothetical protein
MRLPWKCKKRHFRMLAKSTEFLETSVFTRSILELLPGEAYRKLQRASIASPEAGAPIRGGGGIRKLRLARPGRGKSEGTCIIHYRIRERRQIYMPMAYPKSKKDDLSDKETAILRDEPAINSQYDIAGLCRYLEQARIERLGTPITSTIDLRTR